MNGEITSGRNEDKSVPDTDNDGDTDRFDRVFELRILRWRRLVEMDIAR